MIAELINIAQVGLTVAFLLCCWLLLTTWRDGFDKALSVSHRQWKPEDWLVVGIVIGFAGNFVDNLFWGVHWLFDLYDHPATPEILAWGPTSNIVFRQIPGIVAVYCHLRAAATLADAGYSLEKRMMLYTLAGVGSVVAVLVTLFL